MTTENGASEASPQANTKLTARSDLGQHFLRSDDFADLFASQVMSERPATVVEIGAGLGTLSSAICRAGGNLIAVEIDERISGQLTARLDPFGESARVIVGDFFHVPPVALANGSLVVSILPMAPDLARRLTVHALRAWPGARAAFVLMPDAFISAFREDFDVLRHALPVPPEVFWPPYGTDLGVYEVAVRGSA
jgi:16S rRNA (adenine1518-N6/adenine1519-N6)-dimethyltransferase